MEAAQEQSADSIDVQIGARLKAARVARSMSLQAVGDQLGLTYQQVQKYETGKNRISAATLKRLSVILSVDVAEFFPPYEPARVVDTVSVNTLSPRVQAALLELVDAIGEAVLRRE